MAHQTTPYPQGLEVSTRLHDGGEVLIRPITPADAERESAFVRNLSDYSRYYRFMEPIRELTPAMLQRFTHPDYDNEMALIALTPASGEQTQIGVARYAKYPGTAAAEFAIVVADAYQGKGLGRVLMQQLIVAAKQAGLQRLEGFVIASNERMLRLMNRLGFSIETNAEDPRLKTVRLAL